VFWVGYLFIRVGNSAAQIAQAQAAVEAARAAQEAARAAQITGRGLSTISTIQAITLLPIIIAVLVMVGTLVYLLRERRNHNKQLAVLLANQPQHQWAPGPNAGWKRLGTAPARPQLGLQDAMTMTMLNLMASVAQTLQANRPQLPADSSIRMRSTRQSESVESDPESLGLLDNWPALQQGGNRDWDMFLE